MPFKPDNTEGYTQAELDALNEELRQLLEGVEEGTSEYYEIEKSFADEVSRRGADEEPSDYGRFEDSPRTRADMIAAGRGRLVR